MDESTLTAGDLEELRLLEEAMWISETRGDPAWMDATLSPTFTEFGQSGRTHDRASILALPISSHIPVELPFPDFRIRSVGPGVALITYQSVLNDKVANRASVWKHDGTRWLLEFHQGTPALPDDSDAGTP